MGAESVDKLQDHTELRGFVKRLLADLRALEYLIQNGHIESGVCRIGAEQELVLVDETLGPAAVSESILRELEGLPFTTELAQFNIECNLPPRIFGGDSLRRLEEDLRGYLERASSVAESQGIRAVLVGILPTLRKNDLTLNNMTPKPRYRALNDAMCKLRGSSDYDLRVVGIDELSVTHDSIMLESCNTSFQVHFQVAPSDFVDLYNIGQAVAGPLLAACTNSPLLFGKRLWEETRIAIFQQTLETRTSQREVLDRHSRVTFGSKWVEESVVEVFQEDITRMRVLLGGDLEEDPFEIIERGGAPMLRALQMHNGTVYRWLRPCYGVTDGIPHLRLENRFLPAGPTVIDQVANAAFWFGLICAMRKEYGDIRDRLEFDDAKSNFVAAARHGLSAQFHWMNGTTIPAHDLLKEELIPLARRGLEVCQIDSADISRYLDLIDERVRADMTGSRWMLRSCGSLRGQCTERECAAAITAAVIRHQQAGDPVHTWPLATAEDAGDWKANYLRAEQYMTTDLYTVHEDELIDLVACMMDWAQIRHIPVENDDHHLVGLVSYRSLLRLLAQGRGRGQTDLVPVKDIMNPSPITISPKTSTLDAIHMMKSNGVACLPVVEDGRLLGLVTERNFMGIAAELLEQRLREE